MKGRSQHKIIDYIPEFLKYCRVEKNLSDNTLETYKRFLDKFVYWLKDNLKENIKPNDITINDINSYLIFLSNKENNLKEVTKNYYLIALRALLSYFSSKDIVSLPSDKINLLGTQKRKTKKYITIDQINKLLSLPNIKKEDGLRDRVILEILTSTGLKVRQLTKMDRNALYTYQNIYFPKDLIYWIEKYLKTRKDNNEALIINYHRGERIKNRRLTARAIERITNKYGEMLSLPFPLTPENLRLAKVYSIIYNERKNPAIIKNINGHSTCIVKEYKYLSTINNNLIIKSKNDWSIVEKQINNEIDWLKKEIWIMPEKYRNDPDIINCPDCLFYKLATMITGGKISATEYRSTANDSIWNKSIITNVIPSNTITYHGKEWHRQFISIIYKYFKEKNYNIIKEPSLIYGRADLGFFDSALRKTVYIEVGTVSLYKVWFNLLTMKNITFLIVLSEEKLIELKN